MKRYQKHICQVGISILMGIVLCGCGSTSTGSYEVKTTMNQGQTASEESQGKNITVWCWDPAFNIQAMDTAAELYKKSHADVSINVMEVASSDISSKMSTAIKTGSYEDLPDIILMKDNNLSENLNYYDGVFADLTNSGINYSDFAAYKADMGIYQEKHYTVPFDSGVAVMCLREDLIEKAGYKIDDFTDITWSQFIEMGKNIKAKTGLPVLSCQSGSSDFLMMLVQSGGEWLFKDGKPYIADNVALRESMIVYKQLVDSGILMEVNNWNAYTDSINKGEVAGTMNGCWIVSTITAAADQSGKWRITNIPKLDNIEGAVNYSNCGGSSWLVMDSSPNKETAIDFMKSTFGSSTELYSSILPVSGAVATYLPASDSDVYQEPQEYFGGDAIFSKISEYAAFVPSVEIGIYNGSTYDKVAIYLIDYLNGGNIDTLLTNFQTEIEALYE